MKKKKVLILGGSGFIGLGIAKFLGENRNYDITIADIFPKEHKDLDFEEVKNDYSIRLIKGDFTDQSTFDKLDNCYDYVYMLASIVGVNRCIEKPDEVIRVNTSLINNSLDWIVKNNIGKVLFSSSSECYAATTEIFDHDIPTSEEVLLSISDVSHPRFTYAITKILGESAFLNYGRIYNFPVSIVRYQNIFGPRMGFKHVIPHLIERFYFNDENPFKIYGANQTRAFCYISDAAECTVLAMENSDADNEIFHVGSPNEISIKELVYTVGNIMEYSGKYKFAETYPGSVSRRCPDISKAKRILGYTPKVNWEEGLTNTVSWYLDFFESGKIITDGGFSAPNNLPFK